MKRAGAAAILLLGALLLLPWGGPSTAEAGHLRIALSVRPTSFEPLHAIYTVNQARFRQVYETLVEPDYRSSELRFRGLLAESWEASEDLRTWTFHLRPDARFHDPGEPPLWPGGSRPVTAADAAWCFLRLADASISSVSWFALEDLIEGLDAFHDATREGRRPGVRDLPFGDPGLQVPGLEVLDEQTLRIHLVRGGGDLLPRLASAFCVLYPWEAVARGDLKAVPVGSGPFQLELPGSSEVARFRRTPGWRGQEDLGETLPRIERLTLTWVAEGATRTGLFETGRLDRLVLEPDSLHRFLDGEVLHPRWQEKGYRLQSSPWPSTSMFLFNLADPVLGEFPGDPEGNRRRRALREAVARAFPYGRWQSIVRLGSMAVPARSFLPPVLPEARGAPAAPWRSRDLGEVARLLEEAGYPGGEGLPVLHIDLGSQGSLARRSAEVLRQGFREAGIPVEVRLHDFQGQQERIARGEAQIFDRGWHFDWADASNLLATFTGGQAFGGSNRANFVDAEYDRLFAEYLRRPPGPARTRLAHRMLEILHERIPGIPVDHSRVWFVLSPRVQGVAPHAFDPYAFKYYRLQAPAAAAGE